jgi:PTH2 family peptidyl-tRNA hydrolase
VSCPLNREATPLRKNPLPSSRNDPLTFEYKQVILIRTDLKMSRGKIAVQVSHAAVSAAEKARQHHDVWWRAWLDEGQKKVVVKVKSLDELLALNQKAQRLHLPSEVIQDRGLTEVPPGTVTAVGIGPAPSAEVDKITGNLPLL